MNGSTGGKFDFGRLWLYTHLGMVEGVGGADIEAGWVRARAPAAVCPVPACRLGPRAVRFHAAAVRPLAATPLGPPGSQLAPLPSKPAQPARPASNRARRRIPEPPTRIDTTKLPLTYPQEFYRRLLWHYYNVSDPGSNLNKQQRFMIESSRIANQNLLPFFQQWHWTITQVRRGRAALCERGVRGPRCSRACAARQSAGCGSAAAGPRQLQMPGTRGARRSRAPWA